MKTIAIISNLKVLLIYLLMNNNVNSTFFIIDRDIFIPQSIKFYIASKKSRNVIQLICNEFLIFVKLFFYYYKLSLKDLNAYGVDHINGAFFFLKRNPFYLIEDGTENYHLKNYKLSPKRSIKNKLFSLPRFGMYKNVKKIYLTQEFKNAPDIIKNKIEYIDIKSLWNKKTNTEKKNILIILGIDYQKLSLLEEKNIILYTQPLSEDGVITEQEKIKIYKDIISKYDLTKVVIKSHPREKTDYHDVFPNIAILDKSFPSEILELLDIKFDKIVTLFSTAAYQHPKEIVDFYGTSIHPKIYKKFGEIKYE